MFSEETKDGKKKQNKNINNSLNQKKITNSLDINDLVDNLLLRINSGSAVEQTNIKAMVKIVRNISIKKLISITLVLILLFAVIASANSLIESDNISSGLTGITIDDGELSLNNQTVFSGNLNISLYSDNVSYFVNETVFISGIVSFNNTLINASINLMVNGPGYNISDFLNAINGEFNYEFVPLSIGNYNVCTIVTYLNETIQEEIEFNVFGTSDENLTLNNSDLGVWDDTDSSDKYPGSEISFYAKYNTNNQSILNANCLISFDIDGWTEPIPMNYNNGVYIYNRSFDTGGLFWFEVSCSAFGFENQTMMSEFVISKKIPGTFAPISQIKVGQPVKWNQVFQAGKNLSINISRFAYNISISDPIAEKDAVVIEKNIRKNLYDFNIYKRNHILAKGIEKWLSRIKRNPDRIQYWKELFRFYSELKGDISFKEIIDETYENIENFISQYIIEEVEVQLIISNISEEFEITYLTDGPDILEEEFGRGKKQITISSDIHYENILANTTLPIEAPPQSVKLYHIINETKQEVNINKFDLNGNSLIDYIEWIIPHLSNQTYELVIEITQAEHLDENRSFISDIYTEVKTKDDVWSEPIYDGEYVRVTFETTLDKNNDITIYARSNSISDIEVYPMDSNDLITTFEGITGENWYKVYFTNLSFSHSTFDLKTVGDFVEYDYIVDPIPETSVDTISPYYQTSSPLTITATNTNSVDNVTLYYRWSPDNSSWIGSNENKTIGEVQKITNVGDDWTTVDFWNTYHNPIVVTTNVLASDSDNEVCVRVSNLSAASCDIQLENPNDDHAVTSGTIYILIMEEGVHNLSDGRKCEAHTVSSTGTNENNDWTATQTESILYSNSYTNPVVLGQVISYNDSDWSTFWCMDNGGNRANPPGSGDTGCYIGKQVAEDSDVTRSDETLGYIVIEEGSGVLDYLTYECALGADTILDKDDDEFYALGFSASAGVCTLNAMDGNNGGWAVFDSDNGQADEWFNSRVYISVDEDTIGDAERSHTSEQVAYWVFNTTGNITSNESKWILYTNDINPDEADPWSWSFIFPNGTGYYEFYSIGKKSGEAVEVIPISADAICYYISKPTQANEIPANESTGISLIPQLNVTVDDAEENTLNATWWSNSSGLWVQFAENLSIDISSGSQNIIQTNSNFTNHSTTYYWSVNLSDGIIWDNETYHFTKSYPPQLSSPSPANGSTSAVKPICSIYVSDPDGGTVTVRFYENSSNGYVLQQTNSSVDVASPTKVEWNNYSNASVLSQTYWWKVNVSDGKGCFAEEIYYFTTSAGNPPELSNENPSDLSIGIPTSLSTINVTITDDDGDNMDWTIETSPDIGSNSGNNEGNGSKVCSVSGLSIGTLYYWFVNVTDGVLDVNQTFQFKTNNLPQLSGENPTNETMDISISITTINVTITDADSDTMNWTIETSPNIGSNSGNDNASGDNISCGVSGLLAGTTYYWFVNVTDGKTGDTWSNETYYFTTANNPPTIDLKTPSPNGTADVNPLSMCQIWANDTDSVTLDVFWYENSTGSYILRNTNSSVSANSVVNYTFTQFNDYATTYWWKAAVNDSQNNISTWYYFTTKAIVTSVDTIDPYNITSVHLTINASTTDNPDEVSLWYRYSEDNSSISWGNTIGEVRNSSNVDETWTRLNFWNDYSNPVIVAVNNLNSAVDNEVVVRISNVTGTYCDIKLQNPDSDPVTAANVYVIIIEEGAYSLIDGRKLEAYKYEESQTFENGNWGTGTQQTYTNSYTNPVVLGQVMSENDTDWSVFFADDGTRQNPPDSNNLYTCKHVGKDADVTRNPEIVGYIVIEQGSGSIGSVNYATALGADSVAGVDDSPPYTYALGGTYSIGVATQCNEDGGDGGWGVLYGANPISTTIGLAVDEDTTDGSNRVHTAEQVSYWVFSEECNITSNESSGWMIWNNISNPDTGSPWSWDFDFPNDTGYYEFYSIGNKSGSPKEIAPDSADAICHYPNTSIEITPEQWDVGSTTIGNYNYSTSDFYFNLTNEGDASLNIQIKASNATNSTTGALWNLTSTPGLDNYSLQYDKSGGGTWTNINQTYDTFTTNLGIASWQTFDLNIFMAINSTKSDPLSITVTFRSIVA